MNYIIRPIEQNDNLVVGKIIQSVFEELDAPKVGTAYEDPQLFQLFEYYQIDKTQYFVVEFDGVVLGGAGIGACDDENNICELQKMYFLSEIRGKGIAFDLMQVCINFAKKNNYNAIYIETLSMMKDAQKLYLKSGFEFINHSIGKTNHTNCEVYMLKKII